jgi:hypothetical protein
VKVGVAVMADPRRAWMVKDLIAALGEEPVVVWDAGDRCEPCTGLRVLAAHRQRPDATHWVIVQDDAIVCRDFAAGVERLLECVPAGHPLGLYFGAGPPRSKESSHLYHRAKAAGHRWIAMPGSPMWGVGLALPTDQIDPLLDFVDATQRRRQVRSYPPYDGMVRMFYTAHRIEQWFSIPSLVDHRGDHPSLLMAREGDGRVAHEFIGDVSPLDVDWVTGVTR